jgi:predicted transcriptional regulator
MDSTGPEPANLRSIKVSTYSVDKALVVVATERGFTALNHSLSKNMRSKNCNSLYLRSPKLNQMNILHHAEADPHLTQSELARRCGLSVAMVNNYMKDLCDTGLLEYRRRSSKSVSYHVTAEGRRVAGAIESDHFCELVGMFGYAKEQIRRTVLDGGEDEIGRAVIYGSGDVAELAYHALESANVDILGICDPDPARIGREWCGRQIMSPSQIRFIAPDVVVLTTDEPADGDELFHLAERDIRLVRLDGSRGGSDVGVELQEQVPLQSGSPQGLKHE